jgi:transcription elongation factor Elf1
MRWDTEFECPSCEHVAVIETGTIGPHTLMTRDCDEDCTLTDAALLDEFAEDVIRRAEAAFERSLNG